MGEFDKIKQTMMRSPKYKIGDTVFIINFNRLKTLTVERVTITLKLEHRKGLDDYWVNSITYGMHAKRGQTEDYYSKPEEDIFASKEEIKEHLQKKLNKQLEAL